MRGMSWQENLHSVHVSVECACVTGAGRQSWELGEAKYRDRPACFFLSSRTEGEEKFTICECITPLPCMLQACLGPFLYSLNI